MKIVGWLVVLIALNLLIGLLVPENWAGVEEIVNFVLVAAIGIYLVAAKK